MNRAFSRMPGELRTEVKNELRVVAEPVRQRAEVLETRNIGRIGPMRPKSWARMRTGVSNKLTYIAPVQRGRLSRKNPALHRPNLAGLLIRNMEQALREEEPLVVARLNRMLDFIGQRNGF